MEWFVKEKCHLWAGEGMSCGGESSSRLICGVVLEQLQ